MVAFVAGSVSRLSYLGISKPRAKVFPLILGGLGLVTQEKIVGLGFILLFLF
jgi:hypothetical protein